MYRKPHHKFLQNFPVVYVLQVAMCVSSLISEKVTRKGNFAKGFAMQFWNFDIDFFFLPSKVTPNEYKPCFLNKNTVPCSCNTHWISKPFANHNSSTTRNSVICNHHVCNWDATTGRMQLSLVFYATTMDFCPLFGCVCNYGATMITFIPTFGWFLWYIIVYIWYAYTHSCMCNQIMPTMVFW
jgi:hypothetical protein